MSLSRFVVYALVAASFSGCLKAGGNCEEPDFVELSDIRITYRDSATNTYYFTLYESKYDRDGLKARTDNDRPVFLTTIAIDNPSYYIVSLSPIFEPEDSLSFKKEICKNFYVYLDDTTIDTLNVCFKSKENRCGSVFEKLKVNYRGKEIFNQSNTITAALNITK